MSQPNVTAFPCADDPADILIVTPGLKRPVAFMEISRLGQDQEGGDMDHDGPPKSLITLGVEEMKALRDHLDAILALHEAESVGYQRFRGQAGIQPVPVDIADGSLRLGCDNCRRRVGRTPNWRRRSIVAHARWLDDWRPLLLAPRQEGQQRDKRQG